MGTSSSRMDSRPRAKRSLLSSLVCGGASTSSPRDEMEDDSDVLLVNHAKHCHPVSEKFQRPRRKSGLASSAESKFSRPKVQHAPSPESGNVTTEDPSLEDNSGRVNATNRGKGLLWNEEITPQRLSVGCTSRDIASTSDEDQPYSEPVSTSKRVNLGVASSIDNKVNKDMSQICSGAAHSCISFRHEFGDSYSDSVPVQNHANEGTSLNDFDLASSLSDSPINFDLPRNDILQDATPSSLDFVVSNREQSQRDRSLLHLNVTSISPNILSGSNADIGNHETRHNSRRLFWDAFSRRSSRGHSDSGTFVFTSNTSDDLGSHDRWLDLFDNGIGSDTGIMASRVHNIHERRWHSRSEMWERLRGGRDGTSHQTSICPSGVHPNGTCTCESILMSEDSGAHSSISRIVMLAEALFEVLDEIHRQPVAFSLSITSLPAPESLVDSLPVKNHIMTPKAGDDAEQCYICLAEYEEGDKIRVLPCHHEYHLSCVDKWLKEIHGVCPLCRGDVCEGFSEASVSTPEIST